MPEARRSNIGCSASCRRFAPERDDGTAADQRGRRGQRGDLDSVAIESVGHWGVENTVKTGIISTPDFKVFC